MSFFAYEIVTPPAHLPVTVAAADMALVTAVVEECERTILWRAIAGPQQRRIVIDGPLPQILELEPLSGILSITRWTPTDDAVVIPATTFDFISRDPAGAKIFTTPGMNWPAQEREIGSFTITYECGWEVTPESAPGVGDDINAVPAAVRFMIERAIKFREVSGGVGDIKIGSLDLSVPDSYSSDFLPPEITNIARAWMWRPAIFVG